MTSPDGWDFLEPLMSAGDVRALWLKAVEENIRILRDGGTLPEADDE